MFKFGDKVKLKPNQTVNKLHNDKIYTVVTSSKDFTFISEENSTDVLGNWYTFRF
jgi:hypothetical protein